MLHIILQFYAPIPLPSKVLWVGGASMGSLLCTWVWTLPLQRGALPYKKNACVVCVWLYLYILFWCLQSVVTAFDLESYVLLRDLIYVYLISIFKIWSFIILRFAGSLSPIPKGPSTRMVIYWPQMERGGKVDNRGEEWKWLSWPCAKRT